MERVRGALAPYVASVVAYDVALGAPGVHRGLPSTELTLVLPVGEPLDVGWRGTPGSRARRWSTVSGLHAAPAEIHHDGSQTGVQVGLTLAGARALLGIPAAALAGELVELPDLAPDAPAELARLPERLAGEPDPARWASLVERGLVAALSRQGAPAPRAALGHALASLCRGVSVQAVAADVGYSRRHLTSLVRAECGIAPKQLQRVARFQRSRALLRPGRRLADLAARSGYADQAHLTREWTALAGCTPSTWLREEFPFLQDLDGVEAAAWQA